jgi:hypothetical protein
MKKFMLRYWPHVLYPFYRNGFPNIGFLTMTGTEAMFADLCHFSVRSIQVNCVFLLLCLVPPSCLQFRNNLIHFSCPIWRLCAIGIWYIILCPIWRVVFNVCNRLLIHLTCLWWLHSLVSLLLYTLFCWWLTSDRYYYSTSYITHPYQFCLIHLWLQTQETQNHNCQFE